MHILLLVLFATTLIAATPAEIGIQKAQQEIARQPDHAPYYSRLAMAFTRRARETSDMSYYDKAEEAVKKSLKLAPDNVEAQKAQTWLLLGRHEFAAARKLAIELNRRMPDDITIYGFLADANTELGDYRAALEAIQWMLNLRPGNVAGLTRAAYQRELHGDLSGALELMQTAYDATPYPESEDRAWLLTQMSHLELVASHLPAAEKYASAALDVFPGYHYALGMLAQVRIAQKRYGEAVSLLERRRQAAPHAENLYALAEALQLAGRTEEAARWFAEFEKGALAESGSPDNANHELIAYYVDVAGAPGKALAIARQELARRQDLFTLDAYAWALAASGQHGSAAIQIRKALATGVRDPRILRHAAAIEQRAQTPE